MPSAAGYRGNHDPAVAPLSPPNRPLDGSSLGVGSGVIVRQDGLILTNYHVVENADRVTVGLGTSDNPKRVKAKVIGFDPRTDIAVIQLEDPVKNLPVIRFGNSDQTQVGDWAIAIGSPFGLSHTVTAGIISAKGRGEMGVYDIEDFLQTDAAINPGNSGGPLLNLNGEMIGLNSAIYSQTGSSIGIGFAITSQLVKQVADELIEHGTVVRGWLGVVAQDIDSDLAKYFKVPGGQGAVITNIDANGPAGRANAQIGDVVVSFDQTPIKNSADLRTLVTRARAGTVVTLGVIRAGAPDTVTVGIGDSPAAKVMADSPRQQAGRAAVHNAKAFSGLSLQEVPTELRHLLTLPDHLGVLVVNVRPGSPGFDAGLAPGDVILGANGTVLTGTRSLIQFADQSSATELAVLYVQRGPQRRLYVPLKP